MHGKGFTKLHPQIPERLRGTYEALTTEAALEHLTRLGVTAVELMPVHHHAYERHLVERGLSNYWGYNTLTFFAPDLRYSAAGKPAEAVHEFKRMVKALHSAGLEVILDASTTTPRKETTSVPPSRCAASTTRPTTGSCPRTSGIIWTSPAAATR